jgi:hypothetical protein
MMKRRSCLRLGGQSTAYYDVCLTPTQKKKLGLGKKLGCGQFACVWAKGPNRAVKITRDASDVAGLLKAQKTGVVPTVYAVYELKNGGNMHGVGTVPVYALVVERLKPVDQTTPPWMRLESGRSDVIKKLYKAGVNWTDTHWRNFGTDVEGNLKALDLGFTKLRLKKAPKMLAGRKPSKKL